jgi:iron-sulfur cluster assembly accessory protein
MKLLINILDMSSIGELNNINVNSPQYKTFNVGVDEDGEVVALDNSSEISFEGFYMVESKSDRIINSIEITQSAKDKIKEIILSEIHEESNPLPLPTLRIIVRTGGCFGFSYDIGLGSGQDEDIVNDGFVIVDDSVEIEGSSPVLLAIDKHSYRFLDKCQIDFVDEIGGSFFKVNNPQAKGSCGCGNSFSV